MSSSITKSVMTMTAAALLVAIAFTASGCATADQADQAQSQAASALQKADEASKMADRAMQEATAARQAADATREELKVLSGKLDKLFRQSLRK